MNQMIKKKDRFKGFFEEANLKTLLVFYIIGIVMGAILQSVFYPHKLLAVGVLLIFGSGLFFGLVLTRIIKYFNYKFKKSGK